MTVQAALLSARGIGKTVKSGINDLVILQEIDLEVTSGEAVAIVGALLLAEPLGARVLIASAAILGGIAQAKIAHDIRAGLGRLHMNILWEMGGAERVLEATHDLFPDAPVYTSAFWMPAFPPIFSASRSPRN